MHQQDAFEVENTRIFDTIPTESPIIFRSIPTQCTCMPSQAPQTSKHPTMRYRMSQLVTNCANGGQKCSQEHLSAIFAPKWYSGGYQMYSSKLFSHTKASIHAIKKFQNWYLSTLLVSILVHFQRLYSIYKGFSGVFLSNLTAAFPLAKSLKKSILEAHCPSFART